VVARRPHEREAAAHRGLDRRAGREGRCLERRLGGDRVAVQPRWPVDGADPLDVLSRVYKKELVVGRVPALAPPVSVLQQDRQPFRPLRVLAGGVEARERGVGQDVDRTISASVSSSPPARPSR
jgi:hypothetical protein